MENTNNLSINSESEVGIHFLRPERTEDFFTTSASFAEYGEQDRNSVQDNGFRRSSIDNISTAKRMLRHMSSESTYLSPLQHDSQPNTSTIFDFEQEYKPTSVQNQQRLKKKTTGPVHNSKYKAKMCKNWVNKGQCPYYEKCQFAHGHQEIEKWSNRRTKVQPKHLYANVMETHKLERSSSLNNMFNNQNVDYSRTHHEELTEMLFQTPLQSNNEEMFGYSHERQNLFQPMFSHSNHIAQVPQDKMPPLRRYPTEPDADQVDSFGFVTEQLNTQYKRVNSNETFEFELNQLNSQVKELHFETHNTFIKQTSKNNSSFEMN